jgi:protein KTI12
VVEMALITISGYPSSGKTRRAEQIKAALERRLEDPSYAGPKLKVVIISDDTLNIGRDAYNSPCFLHKVYVCSR